MARFAIDIKDFGALKGVRPDTKIKGIEAPLCDTCGALPFCEDSLTIVSANAVNSILYEHNGVQVTIAIAATGAANVAAAVKAALQAYELNVFVTGTVSGSNFVLKHRGQGKIVSASVVTTGTVTATRTCTTQTRCNYTARVNGTITAIIVNGTSRAVTSTAYGTASAATAKTNIQAGVDLASLAGGAVVTVVDDPVSLEYKITISARKGNTFVIGSDIFNETDCVLNFE